MYHGQPTCARLASDNKDASFVSCFSLCGRVYVNIILAALIKCYSCNVTLSQFQGMIHTSLHIICLFIVIERRRSLLKSWIAWSLCITKQLEKYTFFDTILYTYISSDPHTLISSGQITGTVNLRRQSSIFPSLLFFMWICNFIIDVIFFFF